MPQVLGARAGVLKRMGYENKAEELIQDLLPGENYGTPWGLFIYY
jgi:hypothetical protein